MAKFSDEAIEARHPQGMFIDRYPDYPSWLDGNTWELDVATEILIYEPVANFQSSLHYQARQMGLKLVSKQAWVLDGGTRRRVLRVRAY